MKTSRQFLIFAGVGAVGTAAHYSVLILLVQALRTDPVIATTFGFIVGAAINYLLNYRVTFNSDKKHREALIRFFTVAVAGSVINGWIMSAGIDSLDLHYLVAQLVATGIVLLFNYIANRYWTFADRR